MAGPANRQMNAGRFCDRYPVLRRHIDRNYPGFWQDLGDAVHQERERQYTTRGAVVQEVPPSRDASTQTERRVRTVAIQVAMKRPIPRETGVPVEPKRTKVRDAGTQVELSRADVRELGVQAGEREATGPAGEGSRPRAAATPGGEATATRPPRAGEVERCWSCGSLSHFVSTCPRRGDVRYCYRCGRAGSTVKTCPRCQEGWRSQGPFLFGEGHPGGEPLLRRGGPPGSRNTVGPHGAYAYDPRMVRCDTRCPPRGYRADPLEPEFDFIRRN